MACSRSARAVLLTLACSSALLLAGCASNADMEKMRADIMRAQQTADQALRTANAAQSTAAGASQKADQADQMANDANQRLDRVFKKSMMK